MNKHSARSKLSCLISAVLVATPLIGLAAANPADAAVTTVYSCPGGGQTTQIGTDGSGMPICETIFDASGTFTVPNGVTKVDAFLLGGGGAGGSGNTALMALMAEQLNSEPAAPLLHSVATVAKRAQQRLSALEGHLTPTLEQMQPAKLLAVQLVQHLQIGTSTTGSLPVAVALVRLAQESPDRMAPVLPTPVVQSMVATAVMVL